MSGLALRNGFIPKLIQILPICLTKLIPCRGGSPRESAAAPESTPASKPMTIEEVAALQDYAGRYPFANRGC